MRAAINNKDLKYPILTTKLYVPKPRPDLVQRTQLIDRLNKGLEHKLTLISAPAGFGKTTILSEWISQIEIPAAWISLDKSDSDPVPFLNYLVAALQNIGVNFSQASLSILQAAQQLPVESIMTKLINDISATAKDVILVLDDYHSIENEQVHHSVEFLINRLPITMHLIIVGRVDPPLPLAGLRARNQLNELRTADLCFSVDEATVFFNKIMNMGLSGDEISILESRTEGWIAGLQLAALSMQGRKDVQSFIKTFSGDDRHIVDYLVEEVLNLQSGQNQKFLLQTSILSRLSEPLCDYVTGNTGSQKILDELERANLFIIPLDNKRQWYRYHHLFADLLRQRLNQGQGGLVPGLYGRASLWYEKNNMKDEAVEHALKAGDFERAAHLFGEFAKLAWEYGGNTRLLKWYKIIPEEFIHKDPELCFFNAWMLFEHGQYQQAEENLQVVEQLIGSGHEQNDQKTIDPGDKKELDGKVAVIRAYLASFTGKAPEILKYANRALKYLPDSSIAWRATATITLGDAHDMSGEAEIAGQKYSEAADIGKRIGIFFVHLVASMCLVRVKQQQGDLSGSIQIFEQVLQTAQEKGFSETPMMGWLYTRWGEVLGELHFLDEAVKYIRKGLEFSRQGNDAAMMSWSNLVLARIFFIKGDFAGADKTIKKINDIAKKSDIPLFVVEPLEDLNVRLWLRQGKLNAAQLWEKDCELKKTDKYYRWQESEQILFSRILLAQGEIEQSLGLLEKPIKSAEEQGRYTRVIEMLLIQAAALKLQGDKNEAFAVLKKALLLAEPRGFVSIFVMEGAPISELLEKILNTKHDVPRAYVKKLCSAFTLSRLVKPEDGPVERLSERELEVLRLIAAGLSNKKIMEELYLSLSTVKTHIRNIFSKLDVHSRTEVIVKAKELELL